MSACLSSLFIDLNSYFATCEQQDRPELRGCPIAIVPVDADSTCCIAVSYQAKAYGIRTGMMVPDAKALCPHLRLVESRPRLYVEFHHRILLAIERCVPVQQILSCDEFSCQLMGRQREPAEAAGIAYAIKHEIRNVGDTLRCSIGIGPNRLLAKIAGEMQKPDGLMLLQSQHLPSALYCLNLTDIPGLGRRMEKRVRAAGISTVRELMQLSRPQMNRLWDSVLGDRMWLALRGEDFPEPTPGPMQSFSRQHILPPDCRTGERAREIAIKMLHSTAMRLRRNGLWARGLWLQIGYQGTHHAHSGRQYAYQASVRFAPSQDPYTLQAHLTELWRNSAPRTPSDLTIALTDLTPEPTPDLFSADAGPDAGTGDGPRTRVTATLDKLNAKYGLNSVYLGSIHAVRQESPTRISFGPPPPLSDFTDTADPVDWAYPRAKIDHGHRFAGLTRDPADASERRRIPD